MNYKNLFNIRILKLKMWVNHKRTHRMISKLICRGKFASNIDT